MQGIPRSTSPESPRRTPTPPTHRRFPQEAVLPNILGAMAPHLYPVYAAPAAPQSPPLAPAAPPARPMSPFVPLEQNAAAPTPSSHISSFSPNAGSPRSGYIRTPGSILTSTTYSSEPSNGTPSVTPGSGAQGLPYTEVISGTPSLGSPSSLHLVAPADHVEGFAELPVSPRSGFSTFLSLGNPLELELPGSPPPPPQPQLQPLPAAPGSGIH